MLNPLPESVRARAGQDGLFKAGERGPLWRVVEGTARLDRENGSSRLPVQLALPGDLIGIEALCDQPYQFTASAFTDCKLEPVSVASEPERHALLRQALFQQQVRSHDMATLRTGSVLSRLANLLRLMGLPWQGAQAVDETRADALRAALPALRELAQIVDAKSETVCRALAQLLPPRSRKSGPARLNPVPSLSPSLFAPWGVQPMPAGAMA
jgi:Cyclic nucleotide-binding domain